MSCIGGDNGVSMYSASSFDDPTYGQSMMDTTGLGNQQQNQNIDFSKVKPPSPNMIHVSQCKNDKCQLTQIWKNQNYKSNGGASKEFDQQFIPFYPCPKCTVDPAKYCNQRCFQQDWFKQHQFECSGQNPASRDSVLLSDVQRIEASTPFIKEPNDESLLTPEQQKLEQMLSTMVKKDLDFVQSKEANLGKGSYGEVQLAKHRATGLKIAVKKIEKKSLTTNKIKETLIREIRIQKQMNHEYICRLYTSFEDRDTIMLALEYASKGNLFYLIRKEKFLSEDTAFYFFIQVCSGIYFMHKQGLIHRDIKPENILIKEGNIIKICDFGWCVQSDHSQQRNTFCGTLEYMAPEMIQNRDHNHTLDVWALGILLYELVHGRAPFTGVHPREISDKIMRGVIRFKPGLSQEYKDLVNAILKYETAERIPLIKVFDHPWVRNFEKKYNLTKAPPPKKAAAQQRQNDDQKRAEQKALIEAQLKRKIAEEAAAAKEAKRQDKIKQQQLESDLLIQKQKEQEIQQYRKKKKEEEEKQRKAAVLAAAMAASREQSMDLSTNEDDAYKELINQSNDQKKAKKYLDDIKESPRNNQQDVNDHYNKMMQELQEKQRQQKDKNNKNNISQLGNRQESEDEIDIPDDDQTVLFKLKKSKKDKELDKQKMIAAAQAAIKAEVLKQKQERERKKNAPPVLIAQEMNIKSNRKGMATDEKQDPNKTNYDNEMQMSKKERVEQSLKKKQEKDKEEKQKQKQKEQEKERKKQEKENVSIARTQVIVPVGNVDFDKFEEDFKVLDETDMQDDSDSNDSYQTIDNPNLFAKTPGDTPKPKEKAKKTPEKQQEKKPKKQELVVVEQDLSDLSDQRSESPDKESQSSQSEESEEEEKESEKSPSIQSESEVEQSKQEIVQESSPDKQSQNSSQEEEQEEEEYDSEDEDSDSSEDEREERRKNAKNYKKLKGMDPIYDSQSQSESIKKNKKNKEGEEDDFSEDEEPPQNVMQKIGSFLFFGCGGSKDKPKSGSGGGCD